MTTSVSTREHFSSSDANHIELNQRSELSVADLKQIVAMANGEGEWNLLGRRTAFRCVDFDGHKYKVRAFAFAGDASEQLAQVRLVENLFAKWLGLIDNYLITEFVPESVPPNPGLLAEDIGGFIADMGSIPQPALQEHDFDQWIRVLGQKRVFHPRSLRLLQAYFKRALAMDIYWNLEYLDAVPKNFVYRDDGSTVCIDGKHVHPGPAGLAIAKLHSNVGKYCRREDYVAIRSAYQKRMPNSPIDDDAYFEFLVVYYYVYFFVRSAERVLWREILLNPSNASRKHEVLRIIGVTRQMQIVEKLYWGIPRGAFKLLRFPGRVSHFLIRWFRGTR